MSDAPISAVVEPSPSQYRLTVADVAEQTNTNTAWVYRQVESRRIAYVRVGRFLRFSQQDIDDYLARQRVEVLPQGAT
jgi:excisionase family DNA binding protein